jgi:NAD(P)-dependent dehydrogenase (short-subunit alcohol dehydrogenase family)
MRPLLSVLENRNKAARAVAQINGKAFAAELDVTDDLRVKGFIQQVLSDHKRIDILVNNAGYILIIISGIRNFMKVVTRSLIELSLI